VGGDRGLYTTKPVKKGQIVLSDPPLMSISFGSQFCDHCGCQNPNTPVDAIDGYAKYCTVKCRSSAFSQYYAFMSSNESEGMSAKYALLRSQYNSAGSKQAPLTQSFHVLASLRICAITEQCKKRGELPPSQSTFDMPSFRCLLRPGDLGANILERSGFRLPFMDQYRAYEKVRDILPEALQKRANEYDMAWYDNIWGSLMMNCVNGGGVTATGEVTSVCLMRAGSFINHSTENHNAVLLPQRDGTKRLAFIAVRPIAAGEEITISYVDPSLEKEQKTRLLSTQYFIHEEGTSSTDKEAHKSNQQAKISAFQSKIKKNKKKKKKKKVVVAEAEAEAEEAVKEKAPKENAPPPPPTVEEEKKMTTPSTTQVDTIMEIEASATGTVIDADYAEEATLLLEQERLKREVDLLAKESEELKKQAKAKGIL